jgi:glyoxylase-like metal-dependent hydrolase (beta-lactamase superfamily II)
VRVLASLVALLAACTTGTSGGPSPGDAGCSGADCSADGGAEPADAGQASCAGALPAQWATGGPNCPEPELATQRYDRDTYILRQSLCTSFEAPFLHLWLGDGMAMLEDTGDGGVDVVGAVDAAIAQWMTETGNPEPQLIVLNSHGHGDHTAGNGDFMARPNTTVVGATVSDIQSYFAIESYPEDRAELDLGGGRVVDVLAIPGHQSAHIALYDRSRGLLLTGDTLYPGRLYIDDFDAYRASIQRLLDFTASREICQVLGTHIELSTQPGDEFPVGSQSHPGERALELERSDLVELGAAVEAMADNPHRETHESFVIVP